MLAKVFGRSKVVLCNTLRENGGNDKVEEFRGNKYCKIKIENVIRELEINNCAQDDDIPLNYYQINLIPDEDELQFDNEEI